MANSATTKYQDVYTQIRGFISSEKWPLGGTIPSENDLVDYFNVSRITVRSALRLLSDDGLIVRKRGKGTVVTSSMPQAENCFESLTQKNYSEWRYPFIHYLRFSKNN
jgi:DNA-binding GntR family transcriptional regulator